MLRLGDLRRIDLAPLGRAVPRISPNGSSFTSVQGGWLDPMPKLLVLGQWVKWLADVIDMRVVGGQGEDGGPRNAIDPWSTSFNWPSQAQILDTNRQSGST